MTTVQLAWVFQQRQKMHQRSIWKGERQKAFYFEEERSPEVISRGVIDCKQHFASRISEAFCSDGGRGVRWCSWSGKCDGQALASLYPCACTPFLMSMFPLHHVHRYRRCADAETGLSDLSLWEHGTLNDRVLKTTRWTTLLPLGSQ